MEEDKVKEAINLLLSESWFPNWIQGLSRKESFLKYDDFVSHDEYEGALEGIRVMFNADGDVWLSIESERNRRSVRYRMPGVGGGLYPKIRNALLILAEAIRQTNDDYERKIRGS